MSVWGFVFLPSRRAASKPQLRADGAPPGPQPVTPLTPAALGERHASTGTMTVNSTEPAMSLAKLESQFYLL